MSLIKKLIQRLLDSRTTPQQAKDCNDLDFSKEITVLNTTAISSANFTYIAPDAGYIYRWIQCSGKSGTAMGADIIVNGKRMSGLAINNGYIEFGETIRVNKGNSVKFGTWGVSTLAQYLVKFVPLGGGDKDFIRRALSCLRPSFNFLPKNSLLAEATGFLTNPIQLFKRRISHLQRQENGFLSSLLATGGSASKGLPRKFCLATGRFGRGAIQQRHLIKAFVFLSQKAGLWPTYYRQTPRAHMSSLFRVSAINSFQTGGALC